jgi:hypothetical protein
MSVIMVVVWQSLDPFAVLKRLAEARTELGSI